MTHNRLRRKSGDGAAMGEDGRGWEPGMPGESRRKGRLAGRGQSQGRSWQIMCIYGHFMDGVKVFDAFVAVASLAPTQAYSYVHTSVVEEYERV